MAGMRLERELEKQKESIDYAGAAAQKHTDRWAYSHSPFFAAAYVVDPDFIDHDQQSNEEACIAQ